ncbi:class I SAM-dependent methyltransferase [Microbispora sp. RL4-1S]|uniref:Class I SAM-dependent methyltransferase n=1 Tax=Microbispora oryzae TaxID=2806554 RepID=A0A941AJW3_9ACTN|nr:class I SAM-dependent methyltransferase [Microbispora oryzae]MBP2704593.1 class I SAM-dependent methyltransferase [Microbispora oryzae]
MFISVDAPSDLVRRLRERFVETEYTVDGVRERLGDMAASALAREEIVPAMRATRDADPLGTLIRLWWLGAPVSMAAADLPLQELIAAGLLVRLGDSVQAVVHLTPWDTGTGHPGWVVADRKVRPGDPAPRADHVVGAGGASANLAQLGWAAPVGRALDLGTGCGVQVLHLAGRADEVVATDVNRRALRLARLTWELSGVEGVDAREGSMFDPVGGERFDLVVSNPPFVISPAPRYSYRESGFRGDEFCRELIRLTPRHLAAGGHARYLANWLHVKGEDWQDRVGGWLAETGLDGWAVQRDVQDPAEYVELWLRDSAEQGTSSYRERYDEWLAWFESMDVTGVGFGWVALHDSGTLSPVVRVEELPQQVEVPSGAHVPEVMRAAAEAHRLSDDELLDLPLEVADELAEERIGAPGADDPSRIVLRQTRALRRTVTVGTVEAALAGVCDGTLPARPLLSAIAELTGEDEAVLLRQAPELIRRLVAEGFLRVANRR